MARHKVGIKQRQPGRGAHPLMRYDQAVATLSVGTSSVGDDFKYTLFDTSSLSGGKHSKVGKMTIQWFLTFNEQNIVYIAVMKDKEGATTPSLDDETQIRDARSEGRLIRGPWQISTRLPGNDNANVVIQRKTIVLEDLLLDQNDDLIFVLTTRKASTTGTNDIYFFVKTFWKVVE